MAVSPPHGGNTARIPGSVSIPISSVARSSFVALTWVSPSRHWPTTTSYPCSRRDARQASKRGIRCGATPLDGAVMPMRSPGFSGTG